MIAHVAMRLSRRALVNLWRAKLPSLVAVFTIGLALFLGASFLLGLSAVQRLLSGWGAQASITLYLDRNASTEQANALAATVRTGFPELIVVHVDREQALQRLRVELGGLAGALDGLPQNPLPESIEITPLDRLTAAQVRILASRLAQLPFVADVDYGREWVDRLEALSRGVRVFGTGALAAIVAAALLVVANTIRLAVYARRDEIGIMKLVGATDGYVRAPFLLEGALQGLLGAALALSGILATERWLLPRAAEAFTFAALGLAPQVLAAHGAALLAAGTLMGFFGSFIAVSRFLRT